MISVGFENDSGQNMSLQNKFHNDVRIEPVHKQNKEMNSDLSVYRD